MPNNLFSRFSFQFFYRAVHGVVRRSVRPYVTLIPPIITGTSKAIRTSMLYAHSQCRSEQKPIKNFGKSSRGCRQGVPKIFRAPIYRAHRAVIFAIARTAILFILPSSSSGGPWKVATECHFVCSTNIAYLQTNLDK